MVGGLLVVIASFLPWVQTGTRVVDPGFPPTYLSPGQAILDAIHRSGVDLYVLPILLLYWALPLVPVAVGAGLLLAQQWVPSPTVRRACRLAIWLGVVVTAVSAWLYLYVNLDYHGRALRLGPAVALAGYLVALVGVRLVRAVAPAAAR
jgi:hypothetical protein